MSDARFEACLPFILKFEGGNDDDPRDHGGRTSRGITQRENDRWRKEHGLSTIDVWTETNANIKQIYYDNYWLPRCPKLRPGVDLVYFNIAVNAGPGRAETILNKSIGGSDEQTVTRMCDNLLAFYHGLSQFSIYGKGWTNRTDGIRAAALKMVEPEPKEPEVTTTTTTTTVAAPTASGSLDVAKIEHLVEGLNHALDQFGFFIPPQFKWVVLIPKVIETALETLIDIQASGGNAATIQQKVGQHLVELGQKLQIAAQAPIDIQGQPR